jgi:hypothetical protein
MRRESSGCSATSCADACDSKSLLPQSWFFAIPNPCDVFTLTIAMPGTKRGSLASFNPIKHIHADVAEGQAVLLHSDMAVGAATIGGAALRAASDVEFQGDSDVDLPRSSGAFAAVPAADLSSDLRLGVQVAVAADLSSDLRPGVQVAVPPSPVTNRERFIKGFLPARTCCNLDLCRAPAGTKFNLSAVCIAVFPKSSNPDRRYIQLADVTGSVGVTVWNENVNSFSTASVGRLVTLTKVVITNHNGKKALSMARDSSVQQIDDETHTDSTWWRSLLTHAPLSCGAVHDIADNTMVSVSGILGHVSSETKMVQGVPKTLLTLHLVDSSGKLDVRSWNHHADAFNHHADAPILIRRVRVTSFAGVKLCELLDGAGSVIETAFAGDAALRKFWRE